MLMSLIDFKYILLEYVQNKNKQLKYIIIITQQLSFVHSMYSKFTVQYFSVCLFFEPVVIRNGHVIQ